MRPAKRRRRADLVAAGVREVVTGIQALARQLGRTERLWTSPEASEYLAEIERASGDALELLARLDRG